MGKAEDGDKSLERPLMGWPWDGRHGGTPGGQNWGQEMGWGGGSLLFAAAGVAAHCYFLGSSKSTVWLARSAAQTEKVRKFCLSQKSVALDDHLELPCLCVIQAAEL